MYYTDTLGQVGVSNMAYDTVRSGDLITGQHPFTLTVAPLPDPCPPGTPAYVGIIGE
jgi:hypothetical protein